MEAVPIRRDYPPPLKWCLPPPQLDMRFLTAVRTTVLQFVGVETDKNMKFRQVFLKPLCAAIALLCSIHGLYREGDLSPSAPFTWLFSIVNTSLSIAMYGLAAFYWALQDLLEPYRPLSKFTLIKLVVLLPWFQYSSVVTVWFLFGRSFNASGGTYTTVLVYESLLECIELCLLSCFFVTAYPVGSSWIIGLSKDSGTSDTERLSEVEEEDVSDQLKNLLLPEDVLFKQLPPTFPESFAASFVMKLPYIDLSIQMSVRQYMNSGLQRVSYYDGLEQHFVNMATEELYHFVYNGTERICLDAAERGEAPSMINIFPDMEGFYFVGLRNVRGLQCEHWRKNVGRPGEYEDFYFDPMLKRPVQWSMHARNEIISAHLDDYVVNYHAINELVDNGDEKFAPPQQCNGARAAHRKTFAVPEPGPRPRSAGAGDLFSRFASAGRSASGNVGDFNTFKMVNRRSYSNGDSGKYESRFNENLEFVNKINNGNHGVRLELNGFADGFKQPPKGHLSRNGPRPHSHDSQWNLLPADVPIPDRWDWREHDASPPVKDQGTCGSCWAFATVGAIESRHKIVNGAGEKLAEQFLLDCTWNEVNGACLGGNAELTGATLLESFHGFVPLDSQYGKYLSASSYCKHIRTMTGIQIDGWVQLPANADEDTIKRALVNNGLLAISFLVTDQTTFYRSGVINDPQCKGVQDTDHAVNLVGYGTDPDSGLDYWLLRNSWSTNWGDDGYFKIVRGERDCGISLDVSYPIIRPPSNNNTAPFYQSSLESAHMVYRGPEISSHHTFHDAESTDETVLV
ncbi:hypothetical protein FOL47_005831 [Perkinsus chesapeaki]|uniref:Peptidase C1A papain C-terminal domain-containing protein n=1 Tax=Perkinsus chesapeaki TaxID=330153 RepID=A0A7J6LVJ1_PERCH|nr:hypothetical protein FOL47_005831 [Perkinsus chesapeaki]